MEERIRELEEQVKSLQNNLGEMMRIQTTIIKTLGNNSKTLLNLANTDEKIIAAIAVLTGTTDVLN